METRSLEKIKVAIALASTLFFWASSFVAIRAGLRGYDPGSLALLRYIVASICMVFLYVFVKHKQKPSLKEIPAIFIIGVIGFGIYNIALNRGEISVSAGISSFIVSQIPICVIIFAFFILRERIKWNAWLGTAISVLGIGMIAWSEAHEMHFDVGIIFLLIATITGALYAVLHKPFLRKYTPIEFIAYAIWSGTLILFIYIPHLIQEIPEAPMSATWAAIYLGIFPGVVGYVGWSYVLVRMPASRASSFIYTMPIIATIMGWLVLGEIPAILSVIGGLIALGGAIIANLRK